MRLFLSLPEDDVKRLDVLRGELGMNRSEYMRYLLSGQKKQIPASIKQKDLVQKLSQIDLHLRTIALKEGVDSSDILYVHESLKDIRGVLHLT